MKAILQIAIVFAALLGQVFAAEVHHHSRQREIFLHSRTLDTRDAPEFHQEEDFVAFKQSLGSGDDHIHQFLVHFQTPYEASHEKEVRDATGVSFVGYLPHNTWLLESTEADASKVQAHPRVAWVGAMMPQDRMAPVLRDETVAEEMDGHFRRDTLLVTLTPRGSENVEQVGHAILDELVHQTSLTQSQLDIEVFSRSLKIRIQSPKANVFDIAPIIAKQEFVQWMEPEQLYQPLNKWSRGIVQSGVPGVEGETLYEKGLTGAGQVVVVGDTGVEMENCYFEDTVATPFDSYDPTHRTVVSYNTRFGNQVDDFSHGTFVAGMLVGRSTGSASSAEFDGMLPEGKIFVIDLNSGNSSIEVPSEADVRLFPIPNEQGVPQAKLHVYPWGSKSASYNSLDQSVDRYAYSGDREFLPFFGAGNEGRYDRSDLSSVHTPSSAKNAMSIGSSLNSVDSFTTSRPQNEMVIIAQDWYNRACLSDDLSLYRDYGFCASVGRGAPGQFPCENFRDIFCNQFSGTPEDCCLFSYLQPTCCNSTVWNQLLSYPFARGPQTLAWFSSGGPTTDGRIKPDLVAPGSRLYSARKESCGYSVFEGSSYAAANAASAGAMVRQYFVQGLWPASGGSTGVNGTVVPGDGFDPSASLVKATLINSGQPLKMVNENDLNYFESFRDVPNYRYGFGRVQLDQVLEFDDSEFSLLLRDEQSFPTSETGDLLSYRLCIDVPAGASNLKVTLVWADEPAVVNAGVALVNNFDLMVMDSQGREHRSNFGEFFDFINNVEQVWMKQPAAGQYSIYVHPTKVSSSEADLRFSLVVTGQVSESSTCIDGTVCPMACSFHGSCVDGRCQCETPYAGVDCSLTPCVYGCSGNGYCEPSTGACVCDKFWRGSDCATEDAEGSAGDVVITVSEDDNDISPGITAAIAIACFIGGLILGGGLAAYFTVRFILSRQKKRIAAFQAKMKASSQGSAVPLNPDDDSFDE